MASSEGGPRYALGSGKRIGHALVLVLFSIAMMAISFLVLAPLVPEGPFHAAPIEFVGLVVLTAISGFGIVGLALLRHGRVTLEELGWQRDQDLLRDVLFGVAGFLFLSTFIWCIGLTAGFWTSAEFFAELAGYSVAQRFLFFLIGLQAAFIEETIFRGYLQPALIAKLGTAGGIFAAALIFAIYHLNPRPITLASKVIQGLTFGVLKGRERSLFAPATAHFLLWVVLGSL